MSSAAASGLPRQGGSNSLTLERQLGTGNKKTPLLVLRRFRAAMGASLAAQLAGEVEADETGDWLFAEDALDVGHEQDEVQRIRR